MDKENRSGRDFSLELDVAAKFARSGYDIDFGHDADVKATKNGWTVFVECKRLKSKNKIRANVDKGLAQLERRYDSAEDPGSCRGLLAISVGVLVNPSFGFLIGRDVDDIGSQCGRSAAEFLAENSRFWKRENMDQRSLSVAMLMDAPGRVSDRNLPFSLHEVAISSMVDPTSSNYCQLLEICKAFEPRQ